MYQPTCIINKFNDSQIFESLAVDFLVKQTGRVFQKYGRTGQEQHGIDAYVYNGRQYILAQFKNRTSNNSSELINKLRKDIDSAVQHFGREQIQSFIIVTSHDRDTNIQEFCMDKNCEYDIPIGIYFWDNIVSAVQYYQDLYYNYFNCIDVRNTFYYIYNEIILLKQTMLRLKKELRFCFLYTDGVARAFPMCMMINGIKEKLMVYRHTLSIHGFYTNECQLLKSICVNIPDIITSGYLDINEIVRLYVQMYINTERNYNKLMTLSEALLQVVSSRLYNA